MPEGELDFLEEIWGDARPYFVKIIVDAAVATSLYFIMFFFKYVADSFPIPGWAGVFIVNLHSVGIVLALMVFICLFVIDVITIHRRRMK
jgi:hypothetical protein